MSTELDRPASGPPLRVVRVTLLIAGLALMLFWLNIAIVIEGIRNATPRGPSLWDWLLLLPPLSGPGVAAFRGWNTRLF